MDPLLVAQFFAQLLGVQPRDIQSSSLTMQAKWAAGTPGAYAVGGKEPATVLQVGYDHFFWQLSGFIQPGEDPEAELDDYTRVDYNVKVSGEGWNNEIWDKPNNMGSLFSRDGGGRPRSLLPSFLHFGEKSEMQLILTPAPLDPNWLGATRMIGVHLIGVKVASDLITEEIREMFMKRIQKAAAKNMEGMGR